MYRFACDKPPSTPRISSDGAQGLEIFLKKDNNAEDIKDHISIILSSSSCVKPSVLAIKEDDELVVVAVAEVDANANLSLFLFLLCTGLNL